MWTINTNWQFLSEICASAVIEIIYIDLFSKSLLFLLWIELPSIPALSIALFRFYFYNTSLHSSFQMLEKLVHIAGIFESFNFLRIKKRWYSFQSNEQRRKSGENKNFNAKEIVESFRFLSAYIFPHFFCCFSYFFIHNFVKMNILFSFSTTFFHWVFSVLSFMCLYFPFN